MLKETKCTFCGDPAPGNETLCDECVDVVGCLRDMTKKDWNNLINIMLTKENKGGKSC